MATEKKHPTVSFIIPYHNEDIPLLTDCLDSILQLSLSKGERQIIVVDDGSAYSPVNELLPYGDDIIYVRKPNGGLSTARNMGLTLAEGDYVQFVDADDHLVPPAYERCLDVVRFAASPDMVMFQFTSKSSRPPMSFSEPMGPVIGADYMRCHNLHATAWGYIFRRDLLQGLRFTEGIVHEDEEFTPLLTVRATRLYVCSDIAYYYRETRGSITRSADKAWNIRRLDDRALILTRLHRLSATLPPDAQQAMRRRVNQLTMDYLYNIIVSTRSLAQLEERIGRLREEGLFPLADGKYTRKYSLFRLAVNSHAGRRMMVAAAGLLKRMA